MKFNELPQYTSKGNYHVDSDWEYAIEHYFTPADSKTYFNENPDFQRAHVWTEEQQTKYIEHILMGGEQGKAIYLNHPGWMGNFKGEAVVVDGKQRIYAVKRFLNNEITAFGHFYLGFEGRIPSNCNFSIYINNLKTRTEVLTWYLEMNSGGTIHTIEELEKVKNLLTEEN